MPRIDYKKELNAEQLAVVENGEGPCLVLAGAGSGKTRTIVYRVAWLIERGVAPENILLLTFTNKAANEMMTRIGELLGRSGLERPLGLWGGTFHSVANRLLRTQAPKLGYAPNFTILDEDDTKSLLKACVKDLGFDAGRRFPSPAVLREIFSYGRNAGISRGEALDKLHPKFGSLAEDIFKVFELYEKKKRDANAMDFDDLLVRLLELLERDPAFAARLGDQFKYVLVDEFQDTNAVQVAIIRRLAPPGHNLLVVGDDAQSIYSFRAADVRNILEFPDYYPGARVFKLVTNYRSTPEILDLANDIISRNREQFPKELKPAAARLAKPVCVPCASVNQEAGFVADAIEKFLDDGLPPREIAVLFRATHHSQALEFELMKRSIEYDYRGGLRFFERAHVKDALSFLRIRDNVGDEAAWRRVLVIQPGIGEASAGRIFELARRGGSLAQALLAPVEQEIGGRVARGWHDLCDILGAILNAGDSPADQLRAVLKSPYVDYLEAEYPNWRERLEDLEQMAGFAEPYAKVSDFLAEVTLDDGKIAGAKTTPARRPKNAKFNDFRIVLSTIHQAKGLEWDAVFVIHLTASSFPNRNALMEDGGLEEERRLFYVAVTRARKWLFLSHPATIGRDLYSFEGPSMFLEEISPQCLTGGVGSSAGGRPGGRGLVFRDEADQGGFADDEPAIELDGSGGSGGDEMSAIRDRVKKLKSGSKGGFFGHI